MDTFNASRRTFLKLGAVAGMGALGATALSACAPQKQGSAQSGATASASDVKWDGQFDVVVVGFGAAGAASAISAAEAGAKVLLVDKAPEGHEGGNSRFCAQLFVSITDKDKGIAHYQAQRGGFYTPDDVVETYVEGMMSTKELLVSWGLEKDRLVDVTDKGMANLTVEYPELPGADAVRTNFIDGYGKRELWRFLKQSVVDRKDKIDCWYESPAKALIQDADSGAIVGVTIEREGKKVNIAARNGVVMALGGFENSPFYQKTFLGHPKMFAHGTLFNEGDGLAMCQTVGAKLWHMASYESMGVGMTCEADRPRIGGAVPFFARGSIILVGGDARRYTAEDLEQRHGHREIGGTWMIPNRPERNIFIFDANQATTATPPYGNWSAGCVKEIASGKITEAASIAELAQKFSLDPATLQATIDLYNTSAASGVDAFGRQAKSMTALAATGPYYGIEMWPSILNTQGGPERTAKAEIVGANDKPIAHLYSAGEFGGVCANLYQGGSNMAECLVFGNIAGTNAAATKEDAFNAGEGLAYKPGCGDQSVLDQAPDETGLKSGQAAGMALGLGGPIWVKTTTEGAKITNIEILHQTETEGVGTVVFDLLPQAVIAAGTTEGVDIVTGATISSNGFLNAVKDAQSKL
ncbi:FAD-dependent oxidoreductase [Gordonibacter sp.]|uniref:FAD-dependent oxidoreductase n=2 Tax=Gordonibacter sp. TaxID=1968902 RepID=UPI002FC9B906